MTLLALALAVGVVIDDAIVVLENIERHRELGESPRDAASKGTREIAFAATAATFSIAAVFVPVVFVQGHRRQLPRASSALTVAGSVMISLFVALTLTPMLAARMPPPKERAHGSVYHWLERGFAWLEARYRQLARLGARAPRHDARRSRSPRSCVALGFGSRARRRVLPAVGRGHASSSRFETPPGTVARSHARDTCSRDEKWMLAQPELAGLFSGGGRRRSTVRARSRTEGIMFVMLKSRKERKRSAQELVPRRARRSAASRARRSRVFDLSSMMVTGDGAAISRSRSAATSTSPSSTELADEMIAGSQKRGGFVDLDKSLKLGLPEMRVMPDREKAAALGVDARTLAQDDPDHDRRAGRRDVQGGRPAATTSACASRRRTAQRPGLDRAPLRAHARRAASSSCATS